MKQALVRTKFPQDTIDLWKNTGKSDQASAGASNPEQAERGRSWSPWRWILFILLLVVAAESLIGSRYLGQPSESPAEALPVKTNQEAA